MSGAISVDETPRLARMLVERLTRLNRRLVLAESCTAGLIAGAVAGVPGASKVLWGGFVCYTAEAKTAMLDIDPALIDNCGAVSKETAAAMAEGALRISGADIAASVTGLAGPDGDERGTPVGTVWIGTALRGPHTIIETASHGFYFEGGRDAVRKSAVDAVLKLLLEALDLIKA
jgi:PncC family amidohydrolase